MLIVIGLSEQSPEQQVLAIFSVASELSLPTCQAVIEQIFSSDSNLSGDSTDTLSAALLNAINMAVEKGQSAGLELLATLDATVTDKVIPFFSALRTTTDCIDPATRGTRDYQGFRLLHRALYSQIREFEPCFSSLCREILDHHELDFEQE